MLVEHESIFDIVRIHMKRILLLLFVSIPGLLFAQVDKSEVEAFAKTFASENNRSVDEIIGILEKAEFQQEIIDKISRPAEGTMTWNRYRKIFMTEKRIDAGVEFWQEHKETLDAISLESGVPQEIICGIIGVETFFGRIKGSYRVLDALYTLGFGYPRRAKFFKSELAKYLILADLESLDIEEVKGSYAGAMGYSQFMPSSYIAYAKSYEENGTRDLMNSPEDAMASVANYLKVHRWRKNEPITSKATLTREITGLRKQARKPKNKVSDYTAIGFEPAEKLADNLDATMVILKSGEEKEHWFGLFNFYVITRYNHSPMYAMAVHQLGSAIKEKIEQ